MFADLPPLNRAAALLGVPPNPRSILMVLFYGAEAVQQGIYAQI